MSTTTIIGIIVVGYIVTAIRSYRKRQAEMDHWQNYYLHVVKQTTGGYDKD